VRIEAEVVQTVSGDEPPALQHLVVHLALDPAERDHRGLVAGQLEDAAQQARDQPHLRAMPRGDTR
jgi:hypothetical protein